MYKVILARIMTIDYLLYELSWTMLFYLHYFYARAGFYDPFFASHKDIDIRKLRQPLIQTANHNTHAPRLTRANRRQGR